MPISLDDQARLPPMVAHADILERQRQEELRQFRQYLVDTGAVKCLVKMYQHIAKNELRLDNPHLLKNYLAGYQEESPEQQELVRLATENASLADANAALETKANQLRDEIEETKRSLAARTLWRALTSKEFWEGRPTHAPTDLDSPALALTLEQIYYRFCGEQVDQLTGAVLVHLVRPRSLDDEALARVVSYDHFFDLYTKVLSEEDREVVSQELTPRLTAAETAAEPPFEAELMQAVRSSGLYPEHLSEVIEVVELDRSMALFLEAVVSSLAEEDFF